MLGGGGGTYSKLCIDCETNSHSETVYDGLPRESSPQTVVTTLHKKIYLSRISFHLNSPKQCLGHIRMPGSYVCYTDIKLLWKENLADLFITENQFNQSECFDMDSHFHTCYFSTNS